MEKRYIHIPVEIEDKLSSTDKAALNDDFDDYQAFGGSYSFKGWLAHYHRDIYIKLYKTH